jgi:glycosyltransferase involved in cell wall biosynthesis
MNGHDGESTVVTQLLIISYDVVNTRMAGPGIRYWEIAHALGKSLEVTLMTPGQSLPCDGVTSYTYTLGDWSTLADVVSEADVLLLPGNLLLAFPQLVTCGKPLILEATYPYTLESLHFHSNLPRDQQMPSFAIHLNTTRQLAMAGDFFFCASQRQRDYWLGVLDSLGRINPDTYAGDPLLYHLIDIVPLGLPSRRPRYTAPAMRGIIPGIGATDRIVLWGGGLWQWLDPLTLVRAVARVAEKHSDVRLVFPGTRHPNPIVPNMPMVEQTRELCDRLGLTGRVIFFGDWVPHEQWPNYLLEADIGASLHFNTLETHFAFRTRVLDYIWAGVPMIVAGGDITSELVARYGLGEVVTPGDDEAVAAAIFKLLDVPNLRSAYQQGFEQARADLTWEKICEPIVRFCQKPRLAPDRMVGATVPNSISSPELVEQETELARLRELVAGYERGRFIRLMKNLHELRQHVVRLKSGKHR